MKMQQVQHIARSHGLNCGRVTKQQLIMNIQAAEGNFPCFATAFDFECDQHDCLWRQDCFDSVKKLLAGKSR